MRRPGEVSVSRSDSVADALRAAIERLLDDPGSGGGPAQAAKFEVGRMVSAYEALYDELGAISAAAYGG